VTVAAQDLEQLIDEITVDAYGLDEQLTRGGIMRTTLDREKFRSGPSSTADPKV
jgi:hypothetical protein